MKVRSDDMEPQRAIHNMLTRIVLEQLLTSKVDPCLGPCLYICWMELSRSPVYI